MNLLKEGIESGVVFATDASRKITIGGITQTKPVYRIRLDMLFYNDLNDRIATWISQYKNEHGGQTPDPANREVYNAIIEKFIIESNPRSINETKENIRQFEQREPAVVLIDGRIIDGNRRFTCLRSLAEENERFNYLEAIIIGDNAAEGLKQIKMLELAIQHGEEQRVDYNQIDMAIGAYHDIIETKLLTIEEYASSTNESLNYVKKRLETAQLLIELLEFMRVPKQYHIAREMQVYSVLVELVPLLKRCENEEEKSALKESVFSNIMMDSINDQRKFIRSVRSMMDSGLFSSYIKRQQRFHLFKQRGYSLFENESNYSLSEPTVSK